MIGGMPINGGQIGDGSSINPLDSGNLAPSPQSVEVTLDAAQGILAPLVPSGKTPPGPGAEIGGALPGAGTAAELDDDDDEMQFTQGVEPFGVELEVDDEKQSTEGEVLDKGPADADAKFGDDGKESDIKEGGELAPSNVIQESQDKGVASSRTNLFQTRAIYKRTYDQQIADAAREAVGALTSTKDKPGTALASLLSKSSHWEDWSGRGLKLLCDELLKLGDELPDNIDKPALRAIVDMTDVQRSKLCKVLLNTYMNEELNVAYTQAEKEGKKTLELTPDKQKEIEKNATPLIRIPGRIAYSQRAREAYVEEKCDALYIRGTRNFSREQPSMSISDLLTQAVEQVKIKATLPEKYILEPCKRLTFFVIGLALIPIGILTWEASTILAPFIYFLSFGSINPGEGVHIFRVGLYRNLFLTAFEFMIRSVSDRQLFVERDVWKESLVGDFVRNEGGVGHLRDIKDR